MRQPDLSDEGLERMASLIKKQQGKGFTLYILRTIRDQARATSRKYHSSWCDRNNGGPECNCEFSDEEGGKDA
jgi:hypothetical protein